MPYKRGDSPVWWASFVNASGQRVRRSTGATDHKEAKAIESRWRLEAHQQKHWDVEPPREFEAVMVAFLNAHTDKRSANRDRQIVRNLRAFFGGRAMNGLGAQDVRRYVETRRTAGRQPGTINRELALLSAALNHARRELEWDIPNPVAGRKLKEPEGRVRWLSRAEAAALIRCAEDGRGSEAVAEFIRLALNTGMRRGEMLGLEWRRVNLQAGLIHLEARDTKAGRRRSVPLNQEARAVIVRRMAYRAQHCPASPWVFCHPDGTRVQSVRKAFQGACRKAGIDDFTIHDLRHTCAAWLVSAGAPLAAIRDLLGHSTVKMTERYAHLAPENVREAVTLLEGQSRSGHVTNMEGLSMKS